MTKAKKKRAAAFKVGEWWYVRFPPPGGRSLTKVEVVDRTRKVVEIMAAHTGSSVLYEIADLEFVEKVT